MWRLRLVPRELWRERRGFPAQTAWVWSSSPIVLASQLSGGDEAEAGPLLRPDRQDRSLCCSIMNPLEWSPVSAPDFGRASPPWRRAGSRYGVATPDLGGGRGCTPGAFAPCEQGRPKPGQPGLELKRELGPSRLSCGGLRRVAA